MNQLKKYLTKKTGKIPPPLMLAGIGVLAYLFISSLFPLKNSILNLFFHKAPASAAEKLANPEVLSNQVLIKVKADTKKHIRLSASMLTGIDSLDKKAKNYKIKKIEKVFPEGKKSDTADAVFQWYKITLPGNTDKIKLSRNENSKKLDADTSEGKALLAAVNDYAADPAVETAEPNFVITPVQTYGCETQMSLSLAKTSFSVNIGDTISNTLYIKNNGSTTCGPKTISATYLAWWTEKLSQSSVTVAPGQTVAVPYTIYIGPDTVTNTYNNSYLWLASYGAGGVGETIQVAGVTPAPTATPIPAPTLPPGTVCTNAPQVQLQSPTLQSQPGGSVTNTMLVTNPNASACGSRTYIYSRSFPSGWNVAMQNSVTVDPGQTQSVPFTLTLPSTTSTGTYSYNFTVYNNYSDGSGQTQVNGTVNVSELAATPTPSTLLTPNDPYFATTGSWGQSYPDMWGIKKMNIQQAWNVTTGDPNLPVAIIDTGIDRNHPDLAANMWVNSGEIPNNGIDDDGNGYIDDYYGWDMYNNDNDPIDDEGHGTSVAGVVGAVGNNGVGVVGVNWKVKLGAIKALSSSGSGTWEAGAQGIVYAADNGFKVANLSWGGYGYVQIAQDAVRYAHDKGMTVVAAAGNDGSDVTGFSPASNEMAIAVGAVGPDDSRTFSSWASNYGARLDVMAPGSDILTTKAANGGCGGWPIFNTQYCRVPGTSLAAPHVTGLVALLLSKYPTLTNEQLRQILRESSTDLGNAGVDNYFGYGRIDAAKAFTIAASTLPLAPVISSPSGHSTLTGTQAIIGTVQGTKFQQYTLEAGLGDYPTTWTTISSSASAIVDGTLGNLNTSQLAPGTYSLRLTGTTTDNQSYQFQTFGNTITAPVTPTATPAPSNAPVLSRITEDPTNRLLIIEWTAPTIGGTVVSYNLYRNNSLLYQGNTLSYKDTDVSGNTTYSYYVTAQFSDGTISPKSNVFTLTTNPFPTPTNAPIPTPTSTAIPTPTSAPTATPTPTAVPTPTPTTIPTATPTPIPADITPPVLSNISLVDGQSVQGTVTLSASATDDRGVDQVQFFADDVLLASDTTAPYSYSWDTHLVPNGSHVVTIKAYDAAQNMQSASRTISVNNPDITPPSAPTGLTAAATSYNRAVLSWNPSTDDRTVSGYWIIRNGETIGSSTTTDFTDITVTPETTYSYQVIAYDAASNSSSTSNTATITTPSAPDTEAPTTPSNLSATAVSSNQINLSWSASTDNIGVVGYDVFRNNTRIATVYDTSYGDANLSPATQYNYFIVARDAAGNSSAPSNTITAATLNPPIVNGGITGTILSDSGVPIITAKVSFTINHKTTTTYTDSTGRYTFSNIPPAKYNLTYSASGYKSMSVSVTIPNGTIVTQDITLQSNSSGSGGGNGKKK